MSADEDPITLPECNSTGIGIDSTADIDNSFKNILENAVSNGLSSTGKQRLEMLITKYRDIFRIKLGSDPPAKVAPLEITPTSDCKPHRAPQRRYSPPQRAFISNTIRQLEAVGAVYKNPTAKWASPALAVPKPGSNDFRFTVDLRIPNSQTIPISSAMPHLESKFQDISGSTRTRYLVSTTQILISHTDTGSFLLPSQPRKCYLYKHHLV